MTMTDDEVRNEMVPVIAELRRLDRADLALVTINVIGQLVEDRQVLREQLSEQQ
jgi:hypothetical protein